MKGRKADHIGLATNHLEETVQFYVETLGYEVIGSYITLDGVQAEFLQNGDIVYEIFQPLEEISKEIEGKIDHFCFMSDDIEKDYENFKEKGCKFATDGIVEIPTFWENGVRYFKIESPTGEEVEFCQKL